MIAVKELSKTYKVTRKMLKTMGPGFSVGSEIKAADNVSFECHPGRVFGLLGPNGAGKTTTLRVIATMLKPTSGSVEVAGFDVKKDPQKVRERIGFLTGNTGLYGRLTTTEMIKYHADLHGISDSEFQFLVIKLAGIDQDISLHDRSVLKLRLRIDDHAHALLRCTSSQNEADRKKDTGSSHVDAHCSHSQERFESVLA